MIMKHGHKDRFIKILLLVVSATAKVKGFSWLLNEKSMGFQDFSEKESGVQHFDFFAGANNPETKHHRIVKKQMEISQDSNSITDFYKKNQARCVTVDGATKAKENQFNNDKGIGNAYKHGITKSDTISESFIKENNAASTIWKPQYQKLASYSPNFYKNNIKRHSQTDDSTRTQHKKRFDEKIPDPNSLQCLKACSARINSSKTTRMLKKKIPQDPEGEKEVSNEWLDASQDLNQKIPPEFKPKPKKKLKIYHLKTDRKREGNQNKRSYEIAHPLRKSRSNFKNIVTSHELHHQPQPKSIPRIIKKSAEKINRKKTREVSEADSEEEEEIDDDDEEYDEDGADDEDDDDDTDEEKSQKSSKNTEKKGFIKTAKEAVINRAKFQEEPHITFKGNSNNQKVSEPDMKTKQAKDTSKSTQENSKKVLIDADIMVDSTISSALRNILNRKHKSSFAKGTLEIEKNAVTSSHEKPKTNKVKRCSLFRTIENKNMG